MRLLAMTAGLGALLAGGAVAAPDLPVPRHDTLQDYQNACNEANGFTTFSTQTACVKALVSESSDAFLNSRDPDTQLYLLTADKLVDDIRNKRTTVAAARVSLQRALIEVESKHQSEAQADRARAEADRRERLAANQRAAEASQRAQQMEMQAADQQRERVQAINMQAEQERESAVEFCAAQVQARQQQYLMANTTQTNSYALGQQLGMLLSGNSPRSVCERNPQFFQSMPPPPTVTRCQRTGSYGVAQVTCTTN